MAVVVVAAPFFLVGLGGGIMPQPVNVCMELETIGVSLGRRPRVGGHHRLPLGHMETEGNAVRGKKEEEDDQNSNDPTLEELLRHAITLRFGVGQAFHKRTGVYRKPRRNVKGNSAMLARRKIGKVSYHRQSRWLELTD